MRLLIACIAALSTVGCISSLGGNFTHPPQDAAAQLSPDARRLVKDAFDGIAPGAARDFHTHLLTLGTSGSGGYVNPRMLTWMHPVHRFKTAIYMSAAGIDNLDNGDAEYLQRLVPLIRALPNPGRHYLLGFDQHYNRDGSVNPEKSEFYTPNEYVWKVVQENPDIFLPAISVHPWRKDAVEELDRWGKLGVKLIKWLPNAQGMDAADPALDAYYAKVKQYDMTILTHVGEEQAVESEEDQQYGNPLRFRRPLDQGVRIIMAHGGSLGDDEDLDVESGPRPRVASYQLVLRLMREPAYRNNLYIDISAMTQFNRLPGPLTAFLGATDVHDRVLNGSDYPLPGVNALIRLSPLVDAGLLDADDTGPLKEIYGYNPLLFDFVLKRRLHHPQTKKGFPVTVFAPTFPAPSMP